MWYIWKPVKSSNFLIKLSLKNNIKNFSEKYKSLTNLYSTSNIILISIFWFKQIMQKKWNITLHITNCLITTICIHTKTTAMVNNKHKVFWCKWDRLQLKSPGSGKVTDFTQPSLTRNLGRKLISEIWL